MKNDKGINLKSNFDGSKNYENLKVFSWIDSCRKDAPSNRLNSSSSTRKHQKAKSEIEPGDERRTPTLTNRRHFRACNPYELSSSTEHALQLNPAKAK